MFILTKRYKSHPFPSPLLSTLIYFQFISNHFFLPFIMFFLSIQHVLNRNNENWFPHCVWTYRFHLPHYTIELSTVMRGIARALLFGFHVNQKFSSFISTITTTFGGSKKKLIASWSQSPLFMCNFLCVNQCSQQKLNESTLNPNIEKYLREYCRVLDHCRHFIDSWKSFLTATRASHLFNMFYVTYKYIYTYVVKRSRPFFSFIYFAQFGKYEPHMR